MTSHYNYIHNFNYEFSDLAKLVVDSPSMRGIFLRDLALDFASQGDRDKLSKKFKLVDSLYSASKYLYSASIQLNCLDLQKDAFPLLPRHDDLIYSIGNMSYDAVSDFIGEFSKYTCCLMPSIIEDINSSRMYIDVAWDISKPYTTIISRDK